MANLKLYTPCITNDTATYNYLVDVSAGVFTINATQLFKDTLSSNKKIFSCKSPGDNAGIQVDLLQNKTGIQITTSDGISSYVDTFYVDYTNKGIYNTAFIWSGTVGDNAFISNGGVSQQINTANWFSWTGDSSDNLSIGCESDVNLVESGFSQDTNSAVNQFNHNEGTVVYDEGGVYDITLGSGNWDSIFVYPEINTSRKYDVWQNDFTGDCILFYFKTGNIPFKTSIDTLAGYTWLKQIEFPAYPSKYNGIKVLDPRDNTTLLGFDELTDISEDGFIFYNLIGDEDIIKGLIIHGEKQTGECYNKSVDAMSSMKSKIIIDLDGSYRYDADGTYRISN